MKNKKPKTSKPISQMFKSLSTKPTLKKPKPNEIDSDSDDSKQSE